MKKIVPVLFLKDKKMFSDKECLVPVADDISPVEICLRVKLPEQTSFL